MLKFLLFLTISFTCFSQTLTIDTSFNSGGIGISGPSATVKKTLVLSNGKILVVGSFIAYNSLPKKNIVLLNADGTVDNNFDASIGSNGVIWDAAEDSQGRIYVAGIFSQYNNVSRRCIARIFADGSLDMSFNPGPNLTNFDPFGQNNVRLYAVTTASDGKVFIGGTFTFANSLRSFACLDSNGNLDANFTQVSFGQDSTVNHIVLQPDGKVLVGGSLFNGGFGCLSRLNAAGGVDTTFLSNCPVTMSTNSIFLAPDGKILIGGLLQLTNVGFGSTFLLVRLNSDGSLDNSFTIFPAEFMSSGSNSVHSITQVDGGYLVSGVIPSYGNVPSKNIIRLSNSGIPDESFDLGTGFFSPTYPVYIALQGSQVLVSGTFIDYNGASVQAFTRMGFAQLSITDNIIADNFKVYCVNNCLNFEAGIGEVINYISIFDLNGRIVMTLPWRNSQNVKQEHSLTEGVYIVNIKTVSGKNCVKKIFI